MHVMVLSGNNFYNTTFLAAQLRGIFITAKSCALKIKKLFCRLA